MNAKEKTGTTAVASCRPIWHIPKAQLPISLNPFDSSQLTRVAHEKALPFEPLVPNIDTIEAMKEARRGGLKSFATVEDLMADLNAED